MGGGGLGDFGEAAENVVPTSLVEGIAGNGSVLKKIGGWTWRVVADTLNFGVLQVEVAHQDEVGVEGVSDHGVDVVLQGILHNAHVVGGETKIVHSVEAQECLRRRIKGRNSGDPSRNKVRKGKVGNIWAQLLWEDH